MARFVAPRSLDHGHTLRPPHIACGAVRQRAAACCLRQGTAVAGRRGRGLGQCGIGRSRGQASTPGAADAPARRPECGRDYRGAEDPARGRADRRQELLSADRTGRARQVRGAGLEARRAAAAPGLRQLQGPEGHAAGAGGHRRGAGAAGGSARRRTDDHAGRVHGLDECGAGRPGLCRGTGQARLQAGRRVLPAVDRRQLPAAGGEGQAPDEGAVLPEPQRFQLLCQADRGPAGRSGPEHPQGGTGDRRRRGADGQGRLGLHRGRGGQARTAAAGGPRGGDDTEPAQLQDRRQPHRMGHVAAALPRRQAARRRAVAHRGARRRDLALGAVPGPPVRGVRALPGPGQGLVLAHLHGQRRVRLRRVPFTAGAGHRLPAPCQLPASDHAPGQRPAGGDRQRGVRVRAPGRRAGLAALRDLRPVGQAGGAGRRPPAHRPGGALGLRGGQLRLPGGLRLQPERQHADRADRHWAGRRQGRGHQTPEGRQRRPGHALRQPDRAAPGGAQPRSLLQLPARLRHRRHRQQLRQDSASNRARRRRAHCASPTGWPTRGRWPPS